MKTMPEVMAMINLQIGLHKKEVDRVVEELSSIRNRNLTLDKETKSLLMKHTMTLVENKGIISALSLLLVEIQK